MTESKSPPTTQSTKLAGRTSRKESGRWSVARVSELTPGSMKLVEVKGLSIGLFNVHGEFVAVLNLCPHELAPVCRGRLGNDPPVSARRIPVGSRRGDHRLPVARLGI